VVIAVVTASISEHWKTGLHTPAIDRRGEGVRYLAFTNNRRASSKFWEVIRVDRQEKDPRRDAKKYKFFPVDLLREIEPNLTGFLWIDRHCRLLCDPLQLFAGMERDGLFAQHWRGCIYKEAEACIDKRKDSPDKIRQTVDRFRLEGFPPESGLYFGGCFALKATDQAERFAKLWSLYVAGGSRRDQLSLPVALHRSGLSFQSVRNRDHIFQIRGK